MIVSHLQRQNAYFEQRQRSLNDLSTILAQARKLGMVRPGEQPYTITGQPAADERRRARSLLLGQLAARSQ